MPLDLFIEQTALLTKQRLGKLIKRDWMGSNKQGTKNGHIKHWELREEYYEIGNIKSDVCKDFRPDKIFKVNKDSFGVTHKKFLGPSQINVYTDGSKTSDGVGGGYCIFKNQATIAEDKVPMEDDCSVFQAELEAIHKAALYLTKNAQ